MNLDFCFLAMGNSSRNDATRTSRTFSLVLFVISSILLISAFVTPSYCHSADSSLHQEPELQDDHHHQLFSRVQRISARVTRETHVSVRGSQRHREKRHVPLSSTIDDDGGHVEKITVTLPLDGKQYILDLQLNRDLIPKGYFERTQRDNKTVVHRPTYEEAEVCHYHGKIRGLPHSWAAISTCDGIIRGALFDGEQLHYIEPGSSSSKDSIRKEVESNSIFNKDDDASSASWDLIHLKHADLKRNMSCGHGDHHDHQSSFNNILGITNDLLTSHPFKTKNSKLSEAGSAPHLHRVKRGFGSHDDTRVPYNSNAKSRYVEVVIVVDNKKYKELGADIKAVRRRSKDIAGIVNALYAPLNIFIALVGMVVWTESDEIVIKPNGDDTLASFLHYRKERLLKEHPNDNAQLLTAVEFENGVVGKAMQGPICSYKYSGGVNSDFKNNVIGVVATTVAHELGHNFGLSHDTESCTCPSPNNRCIMAASASSNRTMHWSSCSLKDFAYAFDHGMDYCLRNKPESLYDGPTCGNGFTEPGEECDCGLAEHCENPCCDASTCLMHHNATCASGTCCDMETCHVKAGGTTCREATKLCDLPEYCTGDSEFCPDDVKKMDGLTCETPSGKSYCYNGECRTHTDQCRLLWGPSGNNSNDLCYQKNANGSRHAHCGYNLTTEKYAKCDSEDVKCGILHCQMNSEKLEFGYESVSILASFFVNAGGKIHPCRSVIVDFGLSDINPGMVPDGAKCGDNKMCVNQKCVAVDSILGAKYPVCAHDCSGRGVCNSKGNCHCEDGYGGHYCEASGYGGSIDSGPAVDPYGTSKFFKILYVTFLGFIPLIAIITFYIYYAGDYFKKLCYSIITLQAFKDDRSRGGHKPSSNGGFRSVDISSPTAQNHSGQNGAPPGQGGEDFFGQYKGFSLSPIKSSPLPQQRSSGANGTTSASSATSHNNNNVEVTTASTANLPNGSIQSQTNSNVYYSSVPKQTETLLGNSDNKSFRVGNPQTTLVQNSGGNRSVRVSWAQPISSPLPVSPGSEDESANSDTPLYENTGAEKSSPKIQKLAQSPSLQRAKARPVSSPDALNEMKKFSGKGSPAGEPSSPTVKKESTFGSTSALSRIAAAFPFVRNSFRISGSSDDNAKNSGSPGKSNKGFPKHRGTLEISKPILQTDFDKNNSKLQPVTPTGHHDQVDSTTCYANLPAQLQHQESIKKPALKNADRIKAASPPPSTGSTVTKPIPKVQRAHSMIQPSSNRNSVHNSNPNYNSLRRPRPSVPPPKPPEAPPPPPPTYMSSSFSDAKSKFLQSSTPPPVPPPNDAVTSSRASQSPKGIRSSITRFTFGNRSRSASPSSIKPPPVTNYSPNNNTATPSLFKAPIAQVEELNSPCSPPGSANKKDKENIYDTIDEGMVTVALKKSSGLKKKDSCEGSSSGDSSPTQGKKSNGGSSEKIETLSTGSSESNNGGLLSEIISEIQSRNKESIYNSVDRRKKKREKKAAAASAALFASIKQEQSKPEITPKPSLSTLSASRKNSGSNLLASSSTSPREASSFSSPNSSRRYVSPLTNQSFSFYKKPVGPSSTPSPAKVEEAEKPKVVLNPTVVNPPVSTSSSSRPSSFTSLASAKSSTITPPKPIFSSTFSRSSVSPPVVTSSNTAAPVATKPVSTSGTGAVGSALPTVASSAVKSEKPMCAVNGVPKVTTSPSYVAKINYFSNLTQASNTPMKPINSIPAPSKENAAKEIIYAPSNVDLSGEDSRGNGGERGHYAATIRRSRPVYYNNKDLESDLNDANSNPVTDNSTTSNKQGTLGRKPLGIYGSLGRKVATPVIRSNSIEKEKQEARARSRSRESTPDTSTTASSVENETTGSSGGESGSPQVGYKPFNPYLNRPLTFSTFRPSGGAKTSTSSASNNSTPTSRPTLTMNGSNIAKSGLNGTTCSVSSKPVPGVTNGVGVASPVQLRSPNRLVK